MPSSNYRNLSFLFPRLLLVLLIIASGGSLTHAQNAGDIQNQINNRNDQIKKLEEDIRQYNIAVSNAQNEAKTLQSTLKTLDLTKKKINADINLTESKIAKAILTIDQLDDQIGDTGEQITVNKKAMVSALQNIDVMEDTGLFQSFLSKKTVSEVWTDIDNILDIQTTIRDKSKELTTLKIGMETRQSNLKTEKTNLINLRQDLSGKKQAVEYTSAEQSKLLADTKNKEQAFKDLVKKNEDQKEQFEKELFELESKLNIAIHKSSYPAAKHGILSWPLDTVFITQQFGKTVGAEQLYKAGSHNGVDFRASVGTRVKNVLDGVVTGTGDTGAPPYTKCISWGRWVVVKHQNGLSSIYGHLSVISVKAGQTVDTGDLIGYSGNTGYSTAPHLHVSIFATEGLRMEKFVNSVGGCKEVVMPLVDVKAYLDPLTYFPNI